MSLTFVRAMADRDFGLISSAQAETATISYGRPPTLVESKALSKRVELALSAPTHRLMILVKERTPLGYFWLEMRREGLAFLLDFHVAPEQRRRGLGKLLFEEVIRQAKEMGATELRLAVASRNARAKKLFLKAGLVLRRCQVREGASWLELAKSLI